MKESILKRLKKYDTGGDLKKATSFLAKGLKAGANFTGRGFLGPFATILGANKAYATPVYDESGINRFTGEYLGTGAPLPTVDVNQINQELSRTMTPKMQMGGIQPLPGGVAAPIPGSDAVEFMGNKHNESGMGSDSGIMMDPQTEVEDGETMDQVTMKHGGKRDYFFSSHLKKGGMSYADMHKNVLAMGGTQEDVDYLARMQEKAAGRDPNQVAKLGGVVEYQRAGVKIPLETLREAYPGENILNYMYPDPERQKMDKNFAEGNYLYDDDDVTFVDSYGMNFTPDPMKRMPVKSITTSEMEPKLAQAEEFVKEEEKQDYSVTNPEEYAAEMARLYPQNTDKDKEALNRFLNRKIPTEAKIGLGAQFIPVIGSMLTKQKDPEEYEYTPGFTAPIVPGRVRGLKYEAPTQDEARARLASSYLGQQRFLDTSGAGAAGLSNRQALFARKLQAEGTLGAKESADKLKAEAMTKQSEERANLANVQNELRAAMTNAQLIQREADRKQAVDAANVNLRNLRENEKVANRLAILNTLGQGIGTVMGDTMQYKTADRLARATGQYGIYERDKIKEYLRTLPEFRDASEEELNNAVLEISKKV